MEEVSFGEWLKRRRNAVGLTQEQLARQISCSTSALRKFESEERRPSAEVVEQLADFFNIPQEERKSFLSFARGDWRAIPGGDSEESPWRVTRVALRSNLPASTTSFIGREKEQGDITNLLAKNRLVTLIGAGALYSVGKVAWVQGDYERAGRRYDELLALGREMENKFTITYALYGLGKVAEAKGDYASARSYHVEALTIRRGLGNRRVIAYSLDALATLALTQQKAALAARLFGAAEDLQRLIHFTISPRERGEHDQAIAAARAALGEEAFAAAWEAGKKMTLDEAVAFVLNEN